MILDWKRALPAAVGAVLVAACAGEGPQAPLTGALAPVDRPLAAVALQPVSGNPTCAQLFPENLFIREFKLQPEGAPTNKTYTSPDGYLQFTVSSASNTGFNWSSNRGVDGVLLKAGNGAEGDQSAGSNLYVYTPEATSDAGLRTQQGKEISHVLVCYDVELSVSKTAATSYNRSWDWTIQKTGDQTSLLLARGQSFVVNYTAVLTAAKTDADWAVSGTITVTNPLSNESVAISTVSDQLSSGLEATVSCGSLPKTLAGGASMTCTYSSPLPDGTALTNTATATSSTPGIAPGMGTASVTFGSPKNETDECVTVADTRYSLPTGQVCAGQSPKTFSYSIDVGALTSTTCGTSTFTNTASYASTESTPETGSDSHGVDVTVTGCQGGGQGDPDGCTLTQGYWKTHSHIGPAPYDDNWANIPPSGASSPFGTTSASWYTVFWTAPKGGNVYYQLAHQYQAAYLNQLNGATLPGEVAAAITWSAAKFDVWKLGTVPKDDQARAAAFATLLESYNGGALHCSEQNPL